MTWLRAFGVVVVLCMAMAPTPASSAAVMSIDLGSEWMKVALVKPGIPMEIVLNKESKRKTPIYVSITDQEVLVGEDARQLAVKKPKNSFGFLPLLLGQAHNSSAVENYRKMFPHHNLVKSSNGRETVEFNRGDSLPALSPEELLSIAFELAAETAATTAEEPVRSAVITVPPFFTQVERRAVIDAAELAGISVLELINTNAAVALHYGVFRQSEFNSTPQYLVFFDMGASSTVATLAAFSVEERKTKSTLRPKEKVPKVEILSVAYDRNLGGLQFELRLRDHMAKLFQAQKGVKGDVTKDAKAMHKLLKEAKRVKEVLSANTDTNMQIESLMDDIDFKARITREEFEILTADLFQRVAQPLWDCVEKSNVKWTDVSQVMVVGGGMRIPRIQTILMRTAGKDDLGRSINSDEAAALGAVYRAADLSPAFRTKEFLIKDFNMFPIEVDFTRPAYVDEEGVENPAKYIQKVIFPRGQMFPVKKVMTFNHQLTDFTVAINYVEGPEAPTAGSLNISSFHLGGLEKALADHPNDKLKGVKVSFRMDTSGMVGLGSAEILFEKNDTAVKPKSTFEGLSDTFSSFFGGSATPAADEDGLSSGSEDEEAATGSGDESGTAAGEEEPATTASGSESEKPEDSSPPPPPPAADEKADSSQTNTEEPKSSADEGTDTHKSDETSKSDEEAKEQPPPADGDAVPPKPVKKAPKEPKNIKRLLDVAHYDGHYFSAGPEELAAARARLTLLREREAKRREQEREKSSLEAFVYASREKLVEDELTAYLTPEEIEEQNSLLATVTDWLYEEGEAAAAADYREKRALLDKVDIPWKLRMSEATKFVEEVAKLKTQLNDSTYLLNAILKMNETLRYHTEYEIERLQDLINETQVWLDEKIKIQSSTPKHVNPVVLSDEVYAKGARLYRETTTLKKKPPPPPPKKKKTEKKKAKKPVGEGESLFDEDFIRLEKPETSEQTSESTSENPDAPDTTNVPPPAPESTTSSNTSGEDASSNPKTTTTPPPPPQTADAPADPVAEEEPPRKARDTEQPFSTFDDKPKQEPKKPNIRKKKESSSEPPKKQQKKEDSKKKAESADSDVPPPKKQRERDSEPPKNARKEPETESSSNKKKRPSKDL